MKNIPHAEYLYTSCSGKNIPHVVVFSIGKARLLESWRTKPHVESVQRLETILEVLVYTTKEAADYLGISVRRVNSLIESGNLKAQKFGKAWMVEEASVHSRAAVKQNPGRPKMGERDVSNIARYTLMSKDRPVLSFTYNKRTGQTADLQPLEDAHCAPFGIGVRGKTPNKYDLAAWLNARAIPDYRLRVGELLRRSRFASTSELMFDSLGLSLSDPYWFLPEGARVQWSDVNYYENGYEQSLGDFMLGASDTLPESAFLGGTPQPTHSPDATTAGALVKTWIRHNSADYLVKGGFGAENREPYNELLATRLLKRILQPDDFVEYSLTKRHGRVYSACLAMTSLDWELIPAADVATAFSISEGRDLHRSYIAALTQLGVPHAQTSIDKMIVADHLMANYDRHTYNFGLLRNTENLDEFRVAPLFDNGCGFYSKATVGELAHSRYYWEAHPFREYPSQQLALVEDISWFEPAMLDGFSDEIAEVLSENPHLSEEFIAGVQRHTQRQIDAVVDLAAERGRVFPGM